MNQKRNWAAAALLLPAVLLAGCTSGARETGSQAHHEHAQHAGVAAGSSDSVSGKTELTEATEVLRGKEFTLTAKPGMLAAAEGTTVPVWSFNHSVPGPQLRVKQGELVTVKLQNELPEPVSIHWHGYPVPNAMDGIPGVTQNAVQPGEQFTYQFKADVAGTYWYHSHQDSVNQLDRGLYGTLVVEGEEDSKVDRDYTLVLDEWMGGGAAASDSGTGAAGHDMAEGSHGKSGTGPAAETGHAANAAGHGAHDAGHGASHGAAETGHSGHAGNSNHPHGTPGQGHDMSMYNLFTINGKTGEAVERLLVKEGEKVRLRLINAGYMSHELHLHGHEFSITATDGQKINHPPSTKDSLLAIAPGERYDIEFTANNPGVWLLEEHSDNPAAVGMKAAIVYEGAASGADRANEREKLPRIDLMSYGEMADAPFQLDQKFDLEYTMNLGTTEDKGGQLFTINGKTYPDTEMLTVKKGDKVKVRLVNKSESDDHPMHLHGHFFQVLSKNGKAMTGSPIIKDTLNLKPGEEYVVAFIADNPGEWMFHCHDLHHAAAGMVTHLRYEGFQPQFKADPKAGNKPE
ncbi:multicopper oxidase family protein [Paenibacillus turpanensis]|uniref:multicopper oxidase family protein n=1 Tax=Paenibacillus turpanensis TaxID=2689078 RepID=UPI00140B327E|nr:multicopper oxidase family protein [Paenibacillus turpanensis]